MTTKEHIQREALRIAENEAVPVRHSLASARSPEDYENIASRLQWRIEDLFASKLEESGHTIACKAGCDYCCYIKVDALPIEIFLLAEHIKKTFSPEQIAELRERTRSNREKIKNLTADIQKQTKIACPLLKDGKCSSYSVRPMMCRKYHSHTVDPCLAMFNGTATEDRRGEIQEITITLSFVLHFAQKEFEAAGFDSTPYDLSSALDETLSDPRCYKRWRQGKSAFSKDLIAKDWQ